jgi:enoyl-CoA hydratase/carnithine racemase
MAVPVIAAVHGVAFGGGLQLALGADLRYVAPGTRLGFIESQWALCPIWLAHNSCARLYARMWSAS